MTAFVSLSAKKLGEQCFYDQTCQHLDDNSECKQVDHNAMCSCKEEYHEVTHSKPVRRTFCTQGKHDASIILCYQSFINHVPDREDHKNTLHVLLVCGSLLNYAAFYAHLRQ